MEWERIFHSPAYCPYFPFSRVEVVRLLCSVDEFPFRHCSIGRIWGSSADLVEVEYLLGLVIVVDWEVLLMREFVVRNLLLAIIGDSSGVREQVIYFVL
jgi:hypothetical protein